MSANFRYFKSSPDVIRTGSDDVCSLPPLISLHRATRHHYKSFVLKHYQNGEKLQRKISVPERL